MSAEQIIKALEKAPVPAASGTGMPTPAFEQDQPDVTAPTGKGWWNYEAFLAGEKSAKFLLGKE